MTEFHVGRLYLNTKKLFSAIMEFSILRGGKGGGESKFRKDWIFEHNLTLNYLIVTKLHMG